MVNSDGIPLFAGIEDLDDMFITTMEEMDKETEDQITVQHPFYKYMDQQKKIEYRDSIGTHVVVRLLDKENTTVKDFSHYDDVDNTPQDALSEAKFPYGQILGTQMYSREELVKNSGDEQLIDLVETKEEQLNSSMGNHFGKRLMGTQDADGRSIMGLAKLMKFDAKVGNIDPTDNLHGYWNPQRSFKTGTTKWSLATEMREGVRKLVRLCTYDGYEPDVLLCGEDLYDAMQSYAESKLQTTLDELKDQRGWGGFNMFPFNNKVIIYDKDVDTNWDAKTGLLLNTAKGVKLRIHSGTNFVFESWQMMVNKSAKKRDCLLYACLYSRRRNANGLVQFS